MAPSSKDAGFQKMSPVENTFTGILAGTIEVTCPSVWYCVPTPTPVVPNKKQLCCLTPE